MKLDLKQVTLSGEAELALNGAEVVRFNGRDYAPDQSTGFLDFRLSYAFPDGITVYGEVLTEQTVRNSWKSIVNKPLNIGHLVRSYDPENIRRDRIIGGIVDATMEGPPNHIRALATLYKAAEGVDRIMGQHQSGRRKWTVSLEFMYDLGDSGFLVSAAGDGPTPGTPAELHRAGWNYVPLSEAPEDLFASRDWEHRRFMRTHPRVPYAGQWGDRAIYLAMGGLSGTGHYSGVAVVERGAELTAKIERMMAAHPSVAPAIDGLARLRGAVGRIEELVELNNLQRALRKVGAVTPDE